MTMLQERIALITGGARGIGLAIAKELHQRGASLAIFDVAEQAAVAEALAGLSAMYCKVDITKSAEVDEAMKAVIDRFGRLDILVNNAGITRDNLLLRMKDEEFAAVLSTNLGGAFSCTRAAAKYMIKAKRGAIVNISSVVAQKGGYGQANYAAAKSGLEALTRSAAAELAARNIRVNAVAPGPIDTPMLRALPAEHTEAILARVALGRLGQPEDIAKVVAFLVSDDASYVTGQVLGVDGGFKLG